MPLHTSSTKRKERPAGTHTGEDDEKDGVPLTDLTGTGLCEPARKASPSHSFLPSVADDRRRRRAWLQLAVASLHMVRDFSWLVADLLDSSSGSELAAVLHLLPCCAMSNSFLLCSCLVCFGTIIIRVVSAVASHAQLRSCDYWDMMSVWTKVQCKTANQMASQVPTQASALLLPLDPLIPVVPT